MKNKSIFSKIMIVIIIALICLVLTMAIALLFGSSSVDMFDFSKLNISNMIPVIIVGGFISCAVVGILVIILAKDIFVKVKDEFFENDNGGSKK